MSKESLFRRSAIDHHARQGVKSELLRIAPASTAWGFYALYAGFGTLLVFGIFGEVNEYASGPAVVRIEGRTSITTSRPALVGEVLVQPGDIVTEGGALVQLYAAEEANELAAATRQFDDQLAKLLHRPDDALARQSLVELRTRKELAQARFDQRTLRAPHPGTVSDVRVRPGQVVEPGTSVVELEGENAQVTIAALLPGRYRPLLAPGAPLRFELDGFDKRGQQVAIQHVAAQVVGPAEALRFIGRDVADTFPVEGPIVLVRAVLPRATFADDDVEFRFAHGMHGHAETVVRSEPVAFALVPALKEWVQHVF